MKHRGGGKESRNSSDEEVQVTISRRDGKMFRAVQLRVAQAGDLSAAFIQQLHLSTASPWDGEEEAEEKLYYIIT